MDFLDALKVVDDAVDVLLSETASVIFQGVVYDVRGPLDREIYNDEASSARSASLASTFSIQSGVIPEDARGGYLSCRGEMFSVVDYDDPRDGRVVLMLERVYNISEGSHFTGYPYPFIDEGDAIRIDGYPYLYPIIG